VRCFQTGDLKRSIWIVAMSFSQLLLIRIEILILT
jgi:hypothetical protein